MIHSGSHYKVKYLDGIQCLNEEITTRFGFVKSYKIVNRPDAPIFKGILNIMEDGRAVILVNYISYSGVKNKFENYFDSSGFEIVHKNNSTKAEKKFWDSLAVKK